MNVKELTNTDYGSFYQPYIDNCGENELLKELNKNLNDAISLFQSIPISKLEYQYDSNKWTIKNCYSI